MKVGYSEVLAALLLTVLAVTGCGREEHEEVKDKAHTTAAGDQNGVVTLAPEQQTTAGIRVEKLAVAERSPEVIAYGQVLDPQPLLEVLGEVRSAEAALEASSKEFARTKTLHDSDLNASARALEAAKASMQRDQIQVDTARAKLTGSWSAALSKRSDDPRFAHGLTSLEAVLLRVDLPLGEPLTSAPQEARVQSASDAQHSAKAVLLGPSTSSNSQMPGQEFLFILQPNSLSLRPGMSVPVVLVDHGAPESGVIVPRAAIVRHQGHAWIYVQTDREKFLRRPLALDHPTDDGWFLSGLDPSTPVVVEGAQVLLSEELKSQIHLDD